MIGGKPLHVHSIFISETMQKDTTTFDSCLGLWDRAHNRIIIKRETLKNKESFLGVLLHELAHAISGCTDSTRGFENELTKMLGTLSSLLT